MYIFSPSWWSLHFFLQVDIRQTTKPLFQNSACVDYLPPQSHLTQKNSQTLHNWPHGSFRVSYLTGYHPASGIYRFSCHWLLLHTPASWSLCFLSEAPSLTRPWRPSLTPHFLSSSLPPQHVLEYIRTFINF